MLSVHLLIYILLEQVSVATILQCIQSFGAGSKSTVKSRLLSHFCETMLNPIKNEHHSESHLGYNECEIEKRSILGTNIVLGVVSCSVCIY